MSGFLLSSACAGDHPDGPAVLRNASSAAYNDDDDDVDRENRENGSALSGQGVVKRNGRVRRRRGRLTPATRKETPSTPPHLPGLPGRRHGATAASPIDAADNEAVLGEEEEQEQQQQQPKEEQEEEEEEASRIPRSVSFCEVVKVRVRAPPRDHHGK